MKKHYLLQLLCAALLMTTIVSCDEEDDNKLSSEAATILVDGAVSTLQTAAESEVVSVATATGLASEDAFADWTKSKFTGTDAQVAEATEVEVLTNITEDKTWTKDNVYVLKARVTVLSGATLTIEPGTVIKGDASLTGANAAVLMIARGGKIMAEGTKAEPIIFTSTDDEIQPGQIEGTLDATKKAKWGGLVVLGKAPVSGKVDNPQIEGVDASDSNGQYGGSDAADNSGVIKYVSIRHGGAEIADDSEINGLTLGGVGSGTTISYIEIFANSDDGIEFFGGTVDVSNVIVYAVGDDAIDIDQSYSGTVSDFAIYVNEDSDEGLEVDGREGTAKGSFTLENGTITSLDEHTASGDFKSKAQGTVKNVILSKVKLSASFNEEDPYDEKEDAASNVRDGELKFEGSKFDKVEVYTKWEFPS